MSSKQMNLNFKVPTWDFIITDPSTPKNSTPKNSSPKTSSPKTSSPKLNHIPRASQKAASAAAVEMEQINLSNEGPSLNESGRYSPTVKKTKSSTVPSNGSTNSGCSSPVLKFTHYQVPQSSSPNGKSPKMVSIKNSPQSSPLLSPNSPNSDSLSIRDIKQELEQRLYKRQYHKLVEKQIIDKSSEREKLIIQQQQIEQQKHQIELQQQQILQLTQMHQQQFFHQSHLYNHNNNIIFNNNSNSNSNSNNNQNNNNQNNSILITNQNNSFINNHHFKNTPKIQTPISSPGISSCSLPSSPSDSSLSSSSSMISLPPLFNSNNNNNNNSNSNNNNKKSFPSCDLLLKPALPSSPLQNVPSVDQSNFIQLPPIRDEIF